MLPSLLLVRIFSLLLRDPTESHVLGEHIRLTCRRFASILSYYESVIYEFNLSNLNIQFPTSGDVLRNPNPKCSIQFRDGYSYVYTDLDMACTKIATLLKLVTGLKMFQISFCGPALPVYERVFEMVTELTYEHNLRPREFSVNTVFLSDTDFGWLVKRFIGYHSGVVSICRNITSLFFDISASLHVLKIFIGYVGLYDDELLGDVIPHVKHLQFLHLTDAFLMDTRHLVFPEHFRDWNADLWGYFQDESVSERWGHHVLYPFAHDYDHDCDINDFFDFDSDLCLHLLFGE